MNLVNKLKLKIIHEILKEDIDFVKLEHLQEELLYAYYEDLD